MQTKNSRINKAALIFATGFGSGYFPFVPGTVGTAVAVPLTFILTLFLYPYLFIFLSILFFITGVWASTIAEAHFRKKDPRQVNIDEIVGYFIVMFPYSFNWRMVITSFLIFRIMDIIKLPPGRAAEKINGGWGIMIDDIIASIYSSATILIITKIFPSALR